MHRSNIYPTVRVDAASSCQTTHLRELCVIWCSLNFEIANKGMKNQADLTGKKIDGCLLIHNYPELMIEWDWEAQGIRKREGCRCSPVPGGASRNRRSSVPCHTHTHTNTPVCMPISINTHVHRISQHKNIPEKEIISVLFGIQTTSDNIFSV